MTGAGRGIGRCIAARLAAAGALVFLASRSIAVPARRGFIINIASVVGFKGYAGQSAYAASKRAVMGITKSLAVEAQPVALGVLDRK